MAVNLKKNRGNQKGQISLEFMLLLVFLLLYLSTSLLPGIELAARSTQEVESIGQARIAAQKIVSTIDRLQSQTSGARQTITIFIPKDVNIFCSDGTPDIIGFSFELKGPPVIACENDDDNPQDPIKCTRKYPTTAGNTVSCSSGTDNILGGQTVNIVVSKGQSTTTVGLG